MRTPRPAALPPRAARFPLGDAGVGPRGGALRLERRASQPPAALSPAS